MEYQNGLSLKIFILSINIVTDLILYENEEVDKWFNDMLSKIQGERYNKLLSQILYLTIIKYGDREKKLLWKWRLILNLHLEGE